MQPGFTLGQSEGHCVVPFPHRIVDGRLPTMDSVKYSLHLSVFHPWVVDVKRDNKGNALLFAQYGVGGIHRNRSR